MKYDEAQFVGLIVFWISSLVGFGFWFGSLLNNIKELAKTKADESLIKIHQIQIEINNLRNVTDNLNKSLEYEKNSIYNLIDKRINTLEQELKFVKNQINQIGKFLEKDGFKRRFIDKDTLQ